MPNINKKLRQKVLEKTKGHCAYCGIELFVGKPENLADRKYYPELTEKGREQFKRRFIVEHVIPISKGGTDEIDNLLPSCNDCNCLKRSKDLEDFRYQLAWITNAGFVFSQDQITWLQENGFEVPAYEDDFEFYYETL